LSLPVGGFYDPIIAEESREGNDFVVNGQIWGVNGQSWILAKLVLLPSAARVHPTLTNASPSSH
jgi:hypothetical protein